MNGKAMRRMAWFAALAATAALAAACGGSSSSSGSTAAAGSSAAAATSAASTETITLTVGLFGTFGYKEAGLFDEYEKLHPNITIKERARAARTTTTRRCRPASPPAAAWPTSRASRSAASPRSSAPRPTSSSTCKSLGAGDASSTFYPLEVAGRRRPRTARSSASARTSARWRSATARTCSRRPACRPTAPTLAAAVADAGRTTSTSASSTRPRRPRARSAPTPPAASTTPSSASRRSSTTTRRGNLVYKTNPAVKQPGTCAGPPRGRAQREARAVLEPAGTRASRAARSRRSPAPPG